MSAQTCPSLLHAGHNCNRRSSGFAGSAAYVCSAKYALGGACHEGGRLTPYLDRYLFSPSPFSAHPQSERARSSASCRTVTRH
ncbi:hypothetical protein B0H17DRAFT_1052127 [Mycena rosella]|uniref:Uncharacterized protein n=1 Tax=Mycena rosella TaxID=1033263 RepID=A0AAD7GPA8_MYCRO|nr:hypothetical protein B0H17DRAFT_1052127 [Mycena rosella]